MQNIIIFVIRLGCNFNQYGNVNMFYRLMSTRSYDQNHVLRYVCRCLLRMELCDMEVDCFHESKANFRRILKIMLVRKIPNDTEFFSRRFIIIWKHVFL